MDHLQRLLSRQAGQGADPGGISHSAVRDVLKCWKRAGWAHAAIIFAHDGSWVWPTPSGFHLARLAPGSGDLPRWRREKLEQLYAVNEIRLHLEESHPQTRWITERQVMEEMADTARFERLYLPQRDRRLQQRVDTARLRRLHLPDGELHDEDATIIAVEVEHSSYKPANLGERLMELVREQDSLRVRTEQECLMERALDAKLQDPTYDAIWYFASPRVRKHLRQERARLVQQGDVSEQEAARIRVRWYPPANTPEELAQEEQEERASLESIGGAQDASGDQSLGNL